MARLARADLVDPAEVAVFHCINRCVRHSYLCGEDPITGRNYHYRKEWLERRFAWLARWFGIDILGFAIMSNHFHLILRSRPDIVATWDDTSVARRWLMLCPVRKDKEGLPMDPTESELDTIRQDPERLAKIRTRLSDISWLMRMVAEPMARLANREQQVTGRFWEGRYRCVKLCDEPALLACLAYVDLNLVRAGISASAATSEFTSLKRRLDSHRSGREVAPWLAPLRLDESQTGPLPHSNGDRASDKGCLVLTVEEYAQLVEWTGRHVGKGSQASIPRPVAQLLERTRVPERTWLTVVENFGRCFHRVAGSSISTRHERPRRNPTAKFHPGRHELLSTC